MAEVSSHLHHIAVIGLGSMGNRYAKIAHDLEIPPTGIHLCDTDPERLQGRLCGSSVSSVNDLIAMRRLDGGLDMAVISTPALAHVDLLTKLSDAFPHAAMLVEKPLTGTTLEVEDLAPRFFTRCISVGYNWRFHPTASHVEQMAGDIRDVTLYVADEMNMWPGTYGAPLYEFSHELDLITLWTRNPVVEHVTGNHHEIRLHGFHEQGSWRVIIRPHHQPKGRWAKIRLKDGCRMNFSWNRKPRIVERTYHNQLVDVIKTWESSGDPADLRCSLVDGVRTARLIDQAALLQR